MSFILPILLLLEKIIAFLKQVLIAGFFGTDNYTDAYQMAENIVSIVRGAFANSIPITFLTFLVYKKNQKDANVGEFKKDITWLGAIILIGVTAILLLCTNIMTSPSLKHFIWILSPTIVLAYISGMFGTVLEAEKSYVPSKLLSLFTSIFVIISVVLLFKKLGLISIFVGENIALVVHIVLLVFLLQRRKNGIALGFPHYTKDVSNVLITALPLMISSSVYSINSLVDKVVALRIQDGAASVLQYARVLSLDLFPTIIVTAFSSVLVREFSECVSKNNKVKLEKKVEFYLETMVIFLNLVMVVSVVFSKGLISFVYQRGAFDENSMLMTNSAFLGYAVGIPLFAFREVWARVHYAYQNTKLPFISSMIGVAVNLILSITLSKLIGLLGIAVATSASILVSAIINYYFLRRDYGFKLGRVLKEFLKTIPAVLLSLVVSLMIKEIIGSDFVGILVAAIVASLSYFVLCYLFKVNVVYEIINALSAKIKGRKNI